MKIRGIKSFCKENKIDLLLLFGSGSTGKTHAASDIDIAVKFKHGNKVSKLKLVYKLEDFFKGKNIDLVILTSDTDPLLLYEMFFRGTPVYEAKKGLFEKEKLRAWKLYLDTDKIRKMNDKYLENFVKKVHYVT
ncbi:MAG: nucleotidyltransferase domain-containing protein [Nitrospirota bacterium]